MIVMIIITMIKLWMLKFIDHLTNKNHWNHVSPITHLRGMLLSQGRLLEFWIELVDIYLIYQTYICNYGILQGCFRLYNWLVWWCLVLHLATNLLYISPRSFWKPISKRHLVCNFDNGTFAFILVLFRSSDFCPSNRQVSARKTLIHC